MNDIIAVKQRNNQLLEQELLAITEGNANKGADGLDHIRQFERMLQVVPHNERQAALGRDDALRQELGQVVA